MDAIEHLLDIASKNRDREFLIDCRTGERVTFGQVHDYACAIADDILKRGLGKGDRLALLLDNSIDTALLYFGCLYAGIITVPINPAYSRDDINFFLSHSGASIFAVSEGSLEKMDIDVLKKRGLEILLIKDGTGKAKGPDNYWNPRELKRAGNSFVPFNGVGPGDIITIIYTSGTTAQPKGVVHRICDLIDNARLFSKELNIGPENRFYGVLAMTYLGGYYNLLLLPYSASSSVVVSSAFNAQSAIDFWGPARKNGVNTLWLVPTIISILMKMDRGTEGEKFCRENVACALVGTAPLPVQLRHDFEDRYSIAMHENYGLSETLFITTNSPKTPRQDGCVGRVLPGVQVTVLDPSGKSLPYGDEGEIFVRTPYLMIGYFNAEKASTDPLHADEWFATGDIGVLTSNGDLFITGRKKDLIIRGGINISSMSIENVLYSHPKIEKAVVVGIPHDILGEEIVAVVKPAEGINFNDIAGQLKEYCREKLGNAREIGHFFEIDEFPMGATGKILKRQIKELVSEKLKRPTHAVRPAMPAKKQANSIAGRIKRTIERPDPRCLAELKKYSSALISDCINRLGVMNGSVRPVVNGRPFCGPAVTVEEVEGGNLMSHAALELVNKGDVIVIDAKGALTRACWGGLQTQMASLRGVAGVVVFGAVRDFEEIARIGVPVYASGVSSAGPLKGWGGNVNLPVSCAGVAVNPGDAVVADDDGIVVVPRDLVARILPYCEQRLAMENEWLERIKAGETTMDVVGLRDRLKALNIEIEQ